MSQKALKEDCLSKTKVFDCYKEFKNGRQSVVDDHWYDRTTTSVNDQYIDTVKESVLIDYLSDNKTYCWTSSYVIKPC